MVAVTKSPPTTAATQAVAVVLQAVAATAGARPSLWKVAVVVLQAVAHVVAVAVVAAAAVATLSKPFIASIEAP